MWWFIGIVVAIVIIIGVFFFGVVCGYAIRKEFRRDVAALLDNMNASGLEMQKKCKDKEGV